MQIDLIVGDLMPIDGKGMSGTWRVAYELMKHLSAVDFNIISFQGKNLKLGRFISRAVNKHIMHPKVVKTTCGRNLKHIISQYLSYLLHHIDCRNAIITCHDLALLKNCSIFNQVQARFDYKAMRKAAKIIAGSAFTKQEIVENLDIPGEQIEVIYNGIDRSMFYPMKSEVSWERLTLCGLLDNALTDRILLYVGSEHPRKNILTVLRAFKVVYERLHDVFFLKIGRPQNPNTRRDMLRLIKEWNLAERVMIIDYVQDEILNLIYNISSVFVFPSEYEGFGLPVLEAMASGLPVIASNTSALPEVIGDAGMLLDPHDIDGFADGIISILCDSALRQQMVQRGINQARRFDWNISAKKLLKSYEEVCANM